MTFGQKVKKLLRIKEKVETKGIPMNQIYHGNYITLGQLKVYGFSFVERTDFDKKYVGRGHIMIREADGYRVHRLKRRTKKGRVKS